VSSKPVGKIDLAVSIGHGDNKRKEELTFEVWRLRLRLHVWEDPFLVKCVAVGSLSRRAGREGGRGPEQQSCRTSRQHGHDTGEAAPVLHARHRSLVFLLQRCCLLLKDRSPGPMNRANPHMFTETMRGAWRPCRWMREDRWPRTKMRWTGSAEQIKRKMRFRIDLRC
jgi:hypothetical protein